MFTERTRGYRCVMTPNVVARATALLRAVGAAEPSGASTTELARAADLARPTAHRLLTSLADEGFLDRDSATGAWTLGPEMYLLGSAAASRYDITRHARRTVHALAAASGESAFLSTRRGDETVCLVRCAHTCCMRASAYRSGSPLPGWQFSLTYRTARSTTIFPGRTYDPTGALRMHPTPCVSASRRLARPGTPLTRHCSWKAAGESARRCSIAPASPHGR